VSVAERLSNKRNTVVWSVDLRNVTVLKNTLFQPIKITGIVAQAGWFCLNGNKLYESVFSLHLDLLVKLDTESNK
jgi:hypothetical protein